MATIVVSKCGSLSSTPTEDAYILIVKELPESNSVAELDTLYETQAKRIEELLIKSLPGGTYDRLLTHMLSRTASHLRVAHMTTVEDGNV